MPQHDVTIFWWVKVTSTRGLKRCLTLLGIADMSDIHLPTPPILLHLHTLLSQAHAHTHTHISPHSWKTTTFADTDKHRSRAHWYQSAAEAARGWWHNSCSTFCNQECVFACGSTVMVIWCGCGGGTAVRRWRLGWYRWRLYILWSHRQFASNLMVRRLKNVPFYPCHRLSVSFTGHTLKETTLTHRDPEYLSKP